MTAGPNPSGQAVPEGPFQPGAEGPFQPGAAPPPEEAPTPPLHVAPASGAPAAVQTSMHGAGNDRCPSCGAHMAIDQRYCLECGSRRGDPRLPFMDAVVFMDAVRQPQGAAAASPPPPPEKRQRLSPNASLIAGVATLVLAIGVGVLIGRSGEGSSSSNNTPPVIKVENGGGSGAATTAPENGAEPKGEGTAKPGKSTKNSAKAKASTGNSGTTKATEEVFKPNPKVHIAPPTVKKGGACEEGTAGCEHGKFKGNFFE